MENRERQLIRLARTNSSRKDLTELEQYEHRAMFTAIEAGDVERACEAAASHLKYPARRLTLYIQGV
ncbi:FCD domain-containing protein [Thalassorhabdomicrobium marinisediminis]|uniref:FCD domain-containing protein n=1 Tax=Thalassorhabdomicrobium marinisediminis TaxID=2170577 RepID=UPI003CD0C737